MSNPATATTEADGSRTYTYPPTGEEFPSVTTILGATEGKPWLAPWSAGIAAGYAVDNLAELAAIVKRDGRDAAVALAKKQAERIRDRKRDTGGYVHDVVEALVLWAHETAGARGSDIALPVLPDHLAGEYYDDDPVEDVADWMVEGFLNWVSDYNPQFRAAEMTVFHPGLRVAGTLDSIGYLPGLDIGPAGRFIPGPGVQGCIDVKTGKHLSVTWPEQIATYRRCPECHADRLSRDLYPTPATRFGAVLHLRPEHPRCYRFMLISAKDDAAAWNRFRRAVEIFEGRREAKAKPGKVCYPLRPDGTIQQPRIADLDGEGYGRALSPLVKAGINDLEQLAAMDAGDCLAVKGVGGKVLDVIRIMLADHGLHLRGEAPETLKAA